MIITTQHGPIEILKDVNKNQVHIRFTETGGEVITTWAKINKGSIKDPLLTESKEPRWVTTLSNGTTLKTYNLKDVADATGVHEATVRKIAQKVRHNDLIISINKI